MSKRDRILLAAIAIVGVVGGLFWFVIKPARAEAGDLRVQIGQISGETAGLRDQIDRLAQAEKGAAEQSAESFRLSKAVPDRPSTPGTIVQLQRLADRADVKLESIRTEAETNYGSFVASEYEIRVSGRFFDVDDFMYRMHRQVLVDDDDRPKVSGRLFATSRLQIALAQEGGGASAEASDSARRDDVTGTLSIVAFSASPQATSSSDSTIPTATTASAATPTGGTP
jgi:Type II secretion system (T2SS), protein M